MTHTEIIWIVVTLTFASTFGVYATIRYINHNTRPPVNTLVRSGDIELVDYIEPTRPTQAYPDLLEQPFSWNERVHSYWSGTPPSYHTVDRFYIHSYLEDSINIDLIFMFFIFMFSLIIMINFPWRKYLVNGFLMSQLTKIIKIFMKIWILWIVLFIIYYNILRNSLYCMSILIPFSFFEIDFRDSFNWKFNSYGKKPVISYHKVQTLTQDIENLLNSIKDDVNYSMSLSFISSYKVWKDEKEKIYPLFINDAIIVNKESDPILITQFIMKSLNDKDLFLTKGLFNDISINWIDPVILTVIVPIKVKI